VRRGTTLQPAAFAAFALALACAAWSAPQLGAAAEARVRLTGTRDPQIAQAQPVSALDAAQDVSFAFTLPVRDKAGLDAFLAAVYTPGDPLYHQFLKTDEFADRFGPSQSDYDALITFAQAQGLRVTATFSNRAVLDVAGSAAAVESALGVHLMRYRAQSGRVFRAADAEPALPASIAGRGVGVVDLDDAAEPKSNVRFLADHVAKGMTSASPSASGTGPGLGLAPSDIKTAYNLNGITQTGSGQTIALIELDGYTASDIVRYETQFGLPAVNVTRILLDGVSGNPTAPTALVPYPVGPLEVTLDIELAMALAPNLASIRVYEGTSFTNLYNRIASDNNAQQVSSSWYYGVDSATPAAVRNAENTAFQQMAAQGQSFYAASGDFGDKVRVGTDVNNNPILVAGVQDPSAQPWCTGVGGTIVSVNLPSRTWLSETAWSGSGGGVSAVWPLPTYQSSAVTAGSGGSSSFRNLPDVSLDSNSGYSIACFGVWFGSVGGTSCAAPLWASFTALVNQRRAASGLGPMGFLNPTLYYLGQLAGSTNDFHDITTGNNGTYNAVAGYDNVTGWGTMNGGNLFGDLVVNAGVLYADAGFGGFPELGTQTNPYKTIQSAVGAASTIQPTLLYIRGGTYHSVMTITKRMVMVNNGAGVVVLGN
jgi:kumamolisin